MKNWLHLQKRKYCLCKQRLCALANTVANLLRVSVVANFQTLKKRACWKPFNVIMSRKKYIVGDVKQIYYKSREWQTASLNAIPIVSITPVTTFPKRLSIFNSVRQIPSSPYREQNMETDNSFHLRRVMEKRGLLTELDIDNLLKSVKVDMTGVISPKGLYRYGNNRLVLLLVHVNR